MYIVAILIGIYSYSIFTLGILHTLNFVPILLDTILFCGIGFFFLFFKNEERKYNFNISRFELFLFSILIVQIVINIIGVLGPEISFDALWYHLTLPKLYILNHSILYIPGGIFYYSAMPKLAEMVYVPALVLGNEIFAKWIHFLFGILTLIVLYRLSRRYLSRTYSYLVLLVFYANLVVGWETITAYIDLTRTFYELLALSLFLLWDESNNQKWFYLSAIMLGFAITTKVLAVGSLIIFIPLIVYIRLKNKKKISPIFLSLIRFIFVSLLIPLPWFLFSFLTTHNPVYPFFSSIYPVSSSSGLFNPFHGVSDIWELLIASSDPINPFYSICIPLIFLFWKQIKARHLIFFFYVILSVFVWYITPRTGGGRFILPYLPVWSFFAVWMVSQIKGILLKNWFVVLIIFLSIVSIGYRAVANAKFLSVIIGKETKSQFLESHLNFQFGDFYDIDGYFASHIRSTDKVLLYGFHNEYYVDFPFIDSSFIKKGDRFNYIAVQNSVLPARFKNWKLAYHNAKTGVTLYTDTYKSWIY